MGVGSLVITVAPGNWSDRWWRGVEHSAMACDFRDCHSDHSAGLVAGRFKSVEQHRPTEEARLNSLQFVSIVLALCGLVMFLNQAGVAVSAAVSGGSATVSAVFAVVSLIVGLGALLFFGWSSKRSFSPLIRLGWLRDPMVLLHLICLHAAADRRHRFRLCDHQCGAAFVGNQRVPVRRVGAAGCADRRVFRTGGRYAVRPFRTGASDSRRVFRRDLWADSAAGIFHATDTRHACRFLLHFRIWLFAWFFQYHDQCVA